MVESLQISKKGHDDWIEYSYLVKVANELANRKIAIEMPNTGRTGVSPVQKG